MRTIRRYSNRKLYDSKDKHYVTLSDVATAVRSGEDVQVTDHVTGQDITAQTLAQAIYVEELAEPKVSTAKLVEAIREVRSQAQAKAVAG